MTNCNLPAQDTSTDAPADNSNGPAAAQRRRWIGLAAGLGINPLLLAVPTTIAASLAFMMPVATPPNAIVFASGEITVAQMCKAGLWLNIIGIGLVMLLTYTVVAIVLKV
jgi:sodium-dependent dicarboxylate transporter 2/3/5